MAPNSPRGLLTFRSMRLAVDVLVGTRLDFSVAGASEMTRIGLRMCGEA